jgi:hypothetical protein
MGPEQLSGVLDIVMKQSLGGRQLDPEVEKMANARKETMRQQIVEESDVYYTTSRYSKVNA